MIEFSRGPMLILKHGVKVKETATPTEILGTSIIQPAGTYKPSPLIHPHMSTMTRFYGPEPVNMTSGVESK